MKLTLPGNLLLLGEYSVTLPGGKGIALAVDNALLTIQCAPSQRLSIEAHFEGRSYRWREDDPPSKELAMPIEIAAGLENVAISVDSTPFSRNGRKRGLGSSAAVCAGLCYLKLKLQLHREPDLISEVFPLALRHHRAFQGGLGSGYDILTSLLGGVQLITGGEFPKAEATSLHKKFFLLQGDRPMATKSALVRFDEIKQKMPQEVDYFLTQSNQIVESFLLCNDEEIFREASLLNRWLGKLMEIDFEGESLNLDRYRRKGYPAKPLGAGGEVAAVMGEKLPLEQLFVAQRGLQCQE